jgi:hypothetical protein
LLNIHLPSVLFIVKSTVHKHGILYNKMFFTEK